MASEPTRDRCPDALLPDGPVCPGCGFSRGASGVRGGSWVHFPQCDGSGKYISYSRWDSGVLVEQKRTECPGCQMCVNSPQAEPPAAQPESRQVLTEEEIVLALILRKDSAKGYEKVIAAVLAKLDDYPHRRQSIEDARRIERMVLERVGMGGVQPFESAGEPSGASREPGDPMRHPSEPVQPGIEALRERAHEACFMECERLCEQTCEMPGGPMTSVCESLHTNIDALADYARRMEQERDEARALHDGHCGTIRLPVDADPCTPPWRKRT